MCAGISYIYLLSMDDKGTICYVYICIYTYIHTLTPPAPTPPAVAKLSIETAAPFRCQSFTKT